MYTSVYSDENKQKSQPAGQPMGELHKGLPGGLLANQVRAERPTCAATIAGTAGTDEATPDDYEQGHSQSEPGKAAERLSARVGLHGGIVGTAP